MAVEKHKDGTFRVGGMAFATSDEAFTYDDATKTKQAQVTPPPQGQSASTPAVSARAWPSPVSRTAPILVALLVAVIAGALYFGPHWTIYRMKAAIEAKDATAFASHVDFPALKESVKVQLMGKMGDLMKSDGMKDNPFSGLGQMLGMGLMNQMVDTLVSPAGVMLMMAQGKAALAKPGSTISLEDAKRESNFAINYVNYSTAEVRSKDGTPGRFLLHRDGLFTWKLSGIEMPL